NILLFKKIKGGKPLCVYRQGLYPNFAYRATNMCQKEKCVNLRNKKAEIRNKNQESWQHQLDTFIKHYENKQAQLVYHTHFEKRSLERVINTNIVKSVLFEGEVIDRQSRFGEERLVVMSYVKTAPKVYRSIHLVVAPLDEKRWVVITAYSPESQSWKWNEFLDERICFC